MRPVSQDVPIGSSEVSLAQLNERSREIFRQIVESYLATGEPVGSRNLSRLIPMTLSPASVRNVMQDLEQLGLIYAPHTSAGRLPTEFGLRFFVDALMQVGDLSDKDRVAIEGQVAAAGKTVENVLTEASGLLSGLARAAGVVLAAKANIRMKHIEFVRLDPERALVILVAEDGQVENRDPQLCRSGCRPPRSQRRRISSTPISAARRWRKPAPKSRRRWRRAVRNSTN